MLGRVHFHLGASDILLQQKGNPDNTYAFLLPSFYSRVIYPKSVIHRNNLTETSLRCNRKSGVLDHVSRVGVDSICLFFGIEEMLISPGFSFGNTGWRRVHRNKKEQKEKELLRSRKVKPNYWEKCIYPIYLRYQDQMGPFQGGLFVSFSLPALLQGSSNNFSALSCGQTKQALLKLGRIL